LIEVFRNDAQAYCDFIDAWRSKEVQEPFATLLRTLSSLAKSGVALPPCAAESCIEVGERINHAKWQVIAAEINKVTSAACAALSNEHADDNEAVARAAMLWDDLADIYRDLRHGLDVHALGDPGHIAEAVWQWRWGYENHWGEHLFRALMTVHEIRFRLFME
jgi:hypothetical protein